MLTDYHLHLRPDEQGTPPERYFTAENVERYLEAAATAGIEELGVSEHVHRFRQALELWRHPFWEEQAVDDLDAYCEFVRGDRRCGSASSATSSPAPRTAPPTLLEARDFDYVVGSVHFVGEDAVDHEGWDAWERAGDADEVWRRYFEALAECARSGLFDILAHPDLVKVWGRGRPLPERDPRHYYEPAVEAIAESGIAVEVSTAGLRKPVGEIYPAPAFAEMCVEAGAPLLALLRRPPARAGRLRLRPGAGLPRRARRRARSPSSRAGAARLEPLGAGSARIEPMSVGIGYDSHRFAEGRPLVLGGVEIEHELGLAGHSDADVLTHAVIDALLGAAGEGDIGTLFPDDDERWRDADSIDMLRTVVGTIGGRIVNVDATLVCERPRLADHRGEMERLLGEATSARVSVKATTNEGMGWIGRGEGIACIAVASVESQ